jgi:methylaspartate ammonia-lyase
MTTITAVRAVPLEAGFFYDDQAAIKRGAKQGAFAYEGEPATPGFDRIRQPAEAVGVLLELSDGRTALGDCCAVQYAGIDGRDPPFRAADHRPVVTGPVARELVGRSAADFSESAALVEALTVGGESLHSAVRYGVSQALLDAAALAEGTTMTDVLAAAYDTEPATEPIPIYAQSGDARRANAEKMILKGVPVLPHGLFNTVAKVGDDGGTLLEYVSWLSDRVAALGPEGYDPRFHVDVYGTLSEVFGPPYDRLEIIEFFGELEWAAAPHPLFLESPMDAGSRVDQLHAMCELREGLADAEVEVGIVADEWCNTLADIRAFVDAGAADLVQVKTPDLGGVQHSAEAVLYTHGTDTRAHVGGSCTETDLAARASVHVALATRPAQLLAKPGMGVDEGLLVVANEMRRTLAIRAARAGGV